eukprot:SM002143S06544  [mRNA]  locus=s2143:390:1073:+ [translate_table: standard]
MEGGTQMAAAPMGVPVVDGVFQHSGAAQAREHEEEDYQELVRAAMEQHLHPLSEKEMVRMGLMRTEEGEGGQAPAFWPINLAKLDRQ